MTKTSPELVVRHRLTLLRPHRITLLRPHRLTLRPHRLTLPPHRTTLPPHRTTATTQNTSLGRQLRPSSHWAAKVGSSCFATRVTERTTALDFIRVFYSHNLSKGKICSYIGDEFHNSIDFPLVFFQVIQGYTSCIIKVKDSDNFTNQVVLLFFIQITLVPHLVLLKRFIKYTHQFMFYFFRYISALFICQLLYEKYFLL